MKKLVLSLIFLILTSNVYAQDIEGAGILPGNPFYFLDKFGESIQIKFAGQGLPKARMYLSFADERLAETKELIDNGKTERIEKTINEYEEDMRIVDEEVKRAEGIGVDVKEFLKEVDVSTDKHIVVLELVVKKVPEQAKGSLERVLNNQRTKSVELKEKTKAGIDFIDITGEVTAELLKKKEEELRAREAELAEKEKQLEGNEGLIDITGLSIDERETLLKQRMGIIFIIMMIGLYIYFHFIYYKRSSELMKKRK